MGDLRRIVFAGNASDVPETYTKDEVNRLIAVEAGDRTAADLELQEADAALQARIDNIIANGGSAEVTTLWTGDATEVGDVITLSSAMTNFDYLDIFTDHGKFTRIPTTLTGYIELSKSLPDKTSDNRGVMDVMYKNIKITDSTHLTISESSHWQWTGTFQTAPTVDMDSFYISIKRVDGVKYQLPTELTDIRVGANGTTYPTAGDAVRGQITELKEDFTGYLYGVNETFTHTGSTGWDYFLCLLLEGVEYTITNNNPDNNMQTRIYRADDTRIELGLIPAGGTLKFTVPSDEFVRVGGYMRNGASFTITNEYSALNEPIKLADDLERKIFTYQDVEYNLVKGKSIGYSDGAIYSGSDYEATGYIPVTEGEQYEYSGVLGGTTENNATGIAGYDESKNYVQGLVSTGVVYGSYASREYILNYMFTIPSGVSYIAACSAYKGTKAYSLLLKKYNGESIETRLSELETEFDNGVNNDLESLVQISEYNTYVSGYDSSPTTKKANLTLSVCSDVHGASSQWKRFVEKGNEYKDYIDCSICLGDICGANPNSNISFYVPTDSEITLLTVIGNHDVGQNGNVGIDTATAFARYIKPLVDAEFISTSTPYYYKDFSDYKIRVIALYEYEGAATTESATSDNFYRYMTSTQLQWFADTLYNTPSDYTVVVALHQIVYYNPLILDSIFTEQKIYRKVNDAFNGGVGYLFNKMSGDCIGDIVNAFQKGLSINQSYTATIGGESKISSVSKDFSGRGNGKFACYLGGHSHAPFVIRNGTYNDQLQVLLPSASDSPYQRGNDDIRPRSEIANHYFIGIDTTHSFVKVYKVGDQTTQGMIDRNFVALPFSAQT